MVLSYCYRLLPSRRQHRALEAILESQRQLYNAALEERIGAYRRGVTLSYFDQSRSLTLWRNEDQEARTLPVSLHRATLKRLDGAYKAFFRRVSVGEKPGFPRFRGKGWFDSFAFRDMCGIQVARGRIRFNGLPGSLRIHEHRPIPQEAQVKSCAFHRAPSGWRVSISVEHPEVQESNGSRAVGVDLGLFSLAALSTGETFPNLAPGRKHEKRLRIVQRSLQRKRRGSRGYRSCRTVIRRLNEEIRHQRNNHLHQVSAKLAKGHDLIAVEKLNVKALAKSALGKPVRDAAWGTLLSMIRYKAARAGTRIVEVSCHDTSQLCSGCGCRVPKELGTRHHTCGACGLSVDRDVNAARVILQRAGVGPVLQNVAG